MIYKENSDHGRTVRDFVHEFESRTNITLEEIDPETRDGEDFCRTYDIVEYPTILVITDDGILQNMWRGLPTPLIDEVRGYCER